jgi:hypothetical protein
MRVAVHRGLPVLHWMGRGNGHRVVLVPVVGLLTVLFAGAAARPGAAAGSADEGIITLASVRGIPRHRVNAIADYRWALAAVVSVLEQDLGFPRLDADITFYADRDAMEAGLEAEGFSRRLALEATASLDALSSSDRVRLNRAAMLRLPWPERVRVLAHELTHVAQYRLSAGRRGSSEQWLREGFADWTGAQVLQSLGGCAMWQERRRAFEAIRQLDRGSSVPPLDTLRSSHDWVTAHAATSAPPVYHAAFVAVDDLIDRHGLPAVLHYFELFASSDDRDANFQGAFAERLDTFSSAIDALLGQIRRSNRLSSRER